MGPKGSETASTLLPKRDESLFAPLRRRVVLKTKKADGDEPRNMAFVPVGLLIDKPPGFAEMPFA